MSQPIFSKHFRLKTYKTPILRELILYSRSNSRPNQRHVDQLAAVLHRFPRTEQQSYKHLPQMFVDLSTYLSNSKLPQTPSPTRKVLARAFSTRLKRNPSVRAKVSESLSPETRNLAISLNKHKLQESVFKPTVMKNPEFTKGDEHKLVCDCLIDEVDYRKITVNHIGEHKLFISCRFAASDLPLLYENKIHAILSIGQLPKCYPTIKGGYFNLDYEGVAIFKPLQQVSRFLNAKLRMGNTLVQCEDGNRKSVILVMAYLMKETRLPYRSVLEVMRKARPFCQVTQEEEAYLRRYDKN